MGRLEGKVALITGAARGQGRSHAVTMAREGADVIALDIVKQIGSVPYDLASAGDLQDTAAAVAEHGRRVLTVEADVRDQIAVDSAVAQAIEHFGKIDIVAVNHGILRFTPFWEITDTEWQDMLDVNLTGVWRVIKSVTPHLIERKQGSIVVTASANAYEPGRNAADYCAAKAGALMFAKCVALELGPYNVRCNVVCPGSTDTAMINWQGAYDRAWPGATREDMRRGMYGYTALGGHAWIEPEAISNAVLYLASDEASSVTGTSVTVDAGHLILTGYAADPTGTEDSANSDT